MVCIQELLNIIEKAAETVNMSFNTIRYGAKSIGDYDRRKIVSLFSTVYVE